MVAYATYTLLFLVPIAGAQGLLGDRIQVGALGGVSLTDPLRAFGRNESKAYLVGPSVELRVHGGFAIEVDALYRRLGSSGGFSLLSVSRYWLRFPRILGQD